MRRAGLPRTFLRSLLAAADVGIGSRVLDVGCGHGELAACLDALGIECVGIDDSPRNVLEARRNVPRCEFHFVSAGEPLPCADTLFDLVLVRQMGAYRGSLLAAPTLAATSRLLTHVRSAGCLAWLAPSGDAAGDGHGLSCFSRHARLLPGRHEVREIQPGRGLSGTVRTWLARSHPAGPAAALVRLSSEPVTGADWLRAADAASHADHAPCCRWAALPAAEQRRSRAA
jgi:SAM-dependent methyltransferase